MKLTDITAGLLAVLLFCGAALAGLCPLQCELRRGVAVAKQVAGDEGMAMPGEHCHGRMAAIGRPMVSIECSAMPCSQAEVSAAVMDERQGPSFEMAQPIVVVEIAAAQSPLGVRIAWRETAGPPRAGVGFDPLIVALRI